MTNDVFNVKKSKNKAISGRLCTYVQGIWTYTPPSDNITVCADNNESIDELDEDNNCLANIWMCGDVRKDGFVTA